MDMGYPSALEQLCDAEFEWTPEKQEKTETKQRSSMDSGDYRTTALSVSRLPIRIDEARNMLGVFPRKEPNGRWRFKDWR